MNRLKSTVSTLAASALLAGCAGLGGNVTDYEKDVVKKSEEMKQGPSTAPFVSGTGFGPALRCMDAMFVTYGIRDLSVLVEDVPDLTKKVSAGGKDMIISAVSQMTRRSRAIKLIAFSATDATLRLTQGFAASGKLAGLTEDISYMIRGSISQFDESLVKKQGDAGVTFGPVSVGGAEQGSSSILGLDLNVIRLADLALVPGVTAKNSVLVTQYGAGADAEIGYKKFGLNFNFVLSRSEGKAQALRTLAELASIELLGKLVKVPYWSCIGGTDQDPAVASEILDWWETMAADPPTLVRYLQYQMYTRGIYTGDVNGQVDDELLHAVSIYQRAMGMPASSELDATFFKRYLSTDHATVQKKALALLAEDPGPAGKKAAAAAVPTQMASAPDAPRVLISSRRGPDGKYQRGEAYEISVSVLKDAHLYCYLLDENRRVNQFFPNPTQQASNIRGGTQLVFPGSAPFRFIANSRGLPETVACYAAPKDLGQQPLSGFEVARDVVDLTGAFVRVSGPRTGVGVYNVNIQ